MSEDSQGCPEGGLSERISNRWQNGSTTTKTADSGTAKSESGVNAAESIFAGRTETGKEKTWTRSLK
jgi:hypothetical protein